MKRVTWGSDSRSRSDSRSPEAEDRLGGVAEASFLIPIGHVSFPLSQSSLPFLCSSIQGHCHVTDQNVMSFAYKMKICMLNATFLIGLALATCIVYTRHCHGRLSGSIFLTLYTVSCTSLLTACY